MIPNRIHFCFGFADRADEFTLVHYLAVRSAWAVNRPEQLTIYHARPGVGPWWERASEFATFEQIEPPVVIHGRPLKHYAHRADVFRLEKLLAAGGIYLDLDTICLRPFADLRSYATVMGEQTKLGLCNAVILAEAGATFLRAWHEEYRWFRSQGRDRYWDEHSVRLPNQLRVRPDLKSTIHVLPSSAFFYPNYDQPRPLFRDTDLLGYRDSYCVHLWETANARHLGRLTVGGLRRGEFAYAQLARPFLEGLPDDAPLVPTATASLWQNVASHLPWGR